MKKYIFLVILISSFTTWSQAEADKKVQLKPELSIAFISHLYLGDNYLSKGHKQPAVGALLKLNIMTYKQFLLAFEFEKSTLKVDDFEIGGNIDKTNINTFRGILSYRILVSNKILFDPQVKFGSVNLRQKDGSKFYGNQQGNTIGVGTDVFYKLNKTYILFSNFGYNYSFFRVNTTNEFEDYFNHAHSLTITIGIKIN